MNTAPDASNPDLQGEGNYTASRHYNDETKKFVDDGKVAKAAAAAKPGSPEEARELEQAEQEGKSHAKEEDPALKRKSTPGEKSSDKT